MSVFHIKIEIKDLINSNIYKKQSIKRAYRNFMYEETGQFILNLKDMDMLFSIFHGAKKRIMRGSSE